MNNNNRVRNKIKELQMTDEEIWLAKEKKIDEFLAGQPAQLTNPYQQQISEIMERHQREIDTIKIKLIKSPLSIFYDPTRNKHLLRVHKVQQLEQAIFEVQKLKLPKNSDENTKALHHYLAQYDAVNRYCNEFIAVVRQIINLFNKESGKEVALFGKLEKILESDSTDEAKMTEMHRLATTPSATKNPIKMIKEIAQKTGLPIGTHGHRVSELLYDAMTKIDLSKPTEATENGLILFKRIFGRDAKNKTSWFTP